MEEKFEDIGSELQKVELQIAELRGELKATQEKIEAVEEKLEQANAEEKPDIREKLRSLRKREEAIRAELVELQRQGVAFATQSMEREKRVTAVVTARATVDPTAVDQLARQVAERLAIAPPGHVAAASGQVRSRVPDVVERLKTSPLQDQYDAGEVIKLPLLSVRTGQDVRFTQGYVVYRPIFETIYALAAEGLEHQVDDFGGSTPIYLWGPKGIGKSHALRYAVARLWQLRFREHGNFRVLYIDEYCRADFQTLKYELMLCFYDDPDMLQNISGLREAKEVKPFLSDYVQQPGRRLVIVLDQVFDTYGNTELGHPETVFPMNDRAIRVVFASSPRFDLQGRYVGGDRRLARPVAFMEQLSDVECASMAVQLLQNMRAKEHDEGTIHHLQDLECELEVALRSIKAQAPGASSGGQIAFDAKEGDRVDHQFEVETPSQTEATRTAALAVAERAILEQLKEASGNVPLYLREVLLEHLPKSWSVQDACEAFIRRKEAAVRRRTIKHCNKLADQDAEELVDFLSLAIAHGKLPDEGKAEVSVWNMRDLRYVYLLDDGSIRPLCPAAFSGISSALLEITLQVGEQDTSNLLKKLTAAIDSDTTTAMEKGFAQEHSFLARLALQKNCRISATLSSAAAPTGLPGRITLMFNRILRISSVAKHRELLIRKYHEIGASVLFVPRRPNEPFVDAVMCDYDLQVITAFQVTRATMQEHSSSLNFFTAASEDLWKNLIPADEVDDWTKNFIWVLCTTDTPSDGFPNAPGINQYQISYADFVRKGIVETGLADVDTRGPSDVQPIDMLSKAELRALCRNQNIRGVSHYNVDGLRAAVKLHLGIDPTQQELAAKARDEEQHQAKLKKKQATRPREKEAKEEENTEDEALRVLEAEDRVYGDDEREDDAEDFLQHNSSTA